ncbi:hypothetical protein F5I97DRAFT_1829612 [Phlebopus sp. FC_14]|nr:hypothetical protein F5I97DRAFT_1829612 [Phlebopus sp. FC_14]
MPRLDSNESDSEAEQNQATNAKKKSKKSTRSRQDPNSDNSTSSTLDPHEVYLAAIRAITRCIDLWCDVDKVIKAVQLIQQDEASKLGELDEDSTARGVHKQSLRRLIIQIVPSLKIIIDDLTKSNELMIICSKYVALNSFKVAFDPPIFLIVFREIEDLALGAIPMEAKDFPTLFWSGAMPGDDYDLSDMLYGLFRSYFLLQVSRHIFMGPLSALGGDSHATRSCNAVLRNMTTIEPKHIAYICVQAHFEISSKSQWSEVNGELSYFTMELFGDENGRGNLKKKTEGGASTRMSTMELMHVQMQAWVIEQTSTLTCAIPHVTSTSHIALAALTVSTACVTSITLAVSTTHVDSTAHIASTAHITFTPLAASTFSNASTQFAPTSLDPSTCTTPQRNPLIEQEEMVLTPITNKKARVMKGKGKKRAIDPGDAQDNAATQNRKFKCSHK